MAIGWGPFSSVAIVLANLAAQSTNAAAFSSVNDFFMQFSICDPTNISSYAILCIVDSRGEEEVHILLSDGSSSSSRQIITALGLAGYQVDVCIGESLYMGRFSRCVRKVHRSPVPDSDPALFTITRYLLGVD